MTPIRRLMARVNQPAVFVLVFALIEIFSGALLYTNFIKTRQRYFDKELEQLQVAYQAIFNTYEQTARLLFNEITADPEFHTIILQANSAILQANSAEAFPQQALREKLLVTLRQHYRQVWEQNVDGLEFHLPNGINFARVQEPSRYGDALFNSRPSVQLVDTQHLAVKGFEQNANETGFRYLFPIYAQGKYRGILEIGIAIDGIREELEMLFMREFLFLLKKSTSAIDSQADTDARSSVLSEAYHQDDANIFIHEGEATIRAIESAIRSTVARRLDRESAFVATARVQQRDFLVTFLPVFDIERNHAAFFVSYKEDSTVQEYLFERGFIMIGVSVGSIFLLAMVYLLRRSSFRLAQGERRFKLITESMHEGVCVLNQNNRVLFVNRAGLQMLQYKPDELSRVHLSDLTRYQPQAAPEQHGDACPIYQAMAEGQRYTSDHYVLLTKAGEAVQVELTSAPIFQGRTQIGSVVVIRDITLRKQDEAWLQQMNQELQEASRHKSDFLSRMSHELRTPLNAMIGYTTLTIGALKDYGDQSVVQYLLKAERSSRKLLELINDVLDFSKIEAGHMETFIEDVELGDVLEDALLTAEGLLLDNVVELNTNIAEQLPILRTDYTKLTQILNNLIGNAVKFTEHGSVTLRAYQRQQAQGIRIEVEDTGCGIPNEKLATIFESFRQADGSTTRKFGGTGLGLAITKKFCDMLDIEIGMQSVVGKGSLFWLHVPVFCSPSASSDTSTHAAIHEHEQKASETREPEIEDEQSKDAALRKNAHVLKERSVYIDVYPDYARLTQQRYGIAAEA